MDNKISNKANAKIVLSITNILIYEIIMLAILMSCYINYFFYYSNGYVVFFLLYLALFAVFGKLFGCFNLGDTTTTDLFISNSLTLLFSNFFIYVVLCLITLRIIPVWPFILMQAIGMIMTAILLKYEDSFIRKQYPPAKFICIYGEEHDDLIGKLNNPKDLSIEIIKSMSIKDIKYKELDVLFRNIDGIITLDVHHPDKKKLFKVCYKKRLMVYDMPSITDMLIASGEILHMVDTPIIKVNKFGPNQFERIAKRIIDIFGSFVLLVITSPIMLVTAIAIKLNDGGNVFYKQSRLTKDGKEFKIIKFRSMVMNAESGTGAVYAKADDDRITSVGKVIRKFRIDELPQMFNILKGEMSFVGPRPERTEMYDEITKTMPEFDYRLCVKAGLTGYAQVYGKYNTPLRDKLLLDLYYIEKYSLIEDIKLLILTLKVIFKPDAAEGVSEK